MGGPPRPPTPPTPRGRHLAKSDPGGLVGQLLKLSFSRGLSLVISLGTTPVVSRVFLPQDFGLYQMLVAAASWATSFGSLGYFQALPLARDRRQARALLGLCLLLTLGLTLVMLPPAWFSPRWLAELVGGAELSGWVLFIPLLFVAGSLASLVESALTHQKSLGALAAMNLTTTAATRGITIALGLWGGSGVGYLLWGNLLGALAGILLGGIGLWPLLKNAQPPALPSPAELGQAARDHRQFPLVQLWNWVLAATSMSLPVLILGNQFPPETVGFFVFARNLAGLPRQIVSTSVGQAFYGHGAEEYQRTGGMGQSLGRSLGFLVHTTVFGMVFTGLLAEPVFTLAFGPNWRSAGVMAQILAPWFLLEILAGPLTLVPLILRRPQITLAYNVVKIAARGGAALLGGWLGQPLVAVGLIALAGVLVDLHQCLICLRLGGVGVRRVAREMLRELALSLALLAPAAGLYWLGGWTWSALAAAGLAGGAWLLLLRRRLGRDEDASPTPA